MADSNKYEWASTAGTALMAFGVTQQAFGAYYAARSARYEARSVESSMRAAADMSAREAKQAESDAQLTMQEGDREVFRSGLEYRALKGATRASRGAAGIEGGSGSAVEVDASIAMAAAQDRYQIDSNAVRAASLLRLQGAGARGRSIMQQVGADNASRTARAISPHLAGATTFLAGGGQVAAQYAGRLERREIVAANKRS